MHKKRHLAVQVLPWLLAALTLLILLTLAPPSLLPVETDPRLMIVMIALVAFVVNVEVPLIGDSISLGYAAGLLVYLSLGRAANPYEALVVIAIGAAIGGAMRLSWLRERHTYLLSWPLMSMATLTLSMIAGGAVYHVMAGELPIAELHLTSIAPLAGLVAVSAAVYLGLYSLWMYSRGLNVRGILKQNEIAIGLALALPVPFVIAAALIFPHSLGGFYVLTLGLLGLAIGATELGRGQLRYRQQVLELQSLSAVNGAMRTHLDLDVLSETIRLQVETLLQVDHFTLALYDVEHNLVMFPLAFRHGRRVEIETRDLGMDLIDYVIAKKAPLLLEQNPAARARSLDLIPSEEGLSSWLGVPLTAPDRALGGIAVAVDDPQRHFSKRDQRILTAIATQSSVAIENARLYRQAQDRTQQLTSLNTLSAHISGTLDPSHVLTEIVNATLAIARADATAVFQRDAASGTLELAEGSGLSIAFINRPVLPLSPDTATLAVTVQNARTDARVAGSYDILRQEKIEAWIELPLIYLGKSLGILVAYFHAPRVIGGAEVELLRTFATQVAMSLGNAQRYQQTDEALERHVEQLSALAAINQELSSTLQLNNLFRLVLDRALEATRSTYAVLMLRDQAEAMPHVVARRGTSKIGSGDFLEVNAVLESLSTGQVTLENTSAELGDSQTRLIVPIVRDYEVLGLVILEGQRPDTYTPDDISFVTQLATLATIAIDNARVFEWMQDSHNRLQVILDSMQEAVILLDIDGRVALANPRVKALLGLEAEMILNQRLDQLLDRPELAFAERLGFQSKEVLRALMDSLKRSTWEGSGRYSYRLEQPQVRFLNRTVVAVLDQTHKIMGLLMVFADATEERELAQAREDLTRMIVHDLRSPLTAISTSMKLLNEIVPADGTMGRSVQQTTEVSQRALRKLLNLVDSLLDIAKMESGNMTLEVDEVLLRPIAEGVRLELLPLAEELDIKIDILIAPDFPPLEIDGAKVERVLLNLVDNALKFTPLEGLVQVRARCQDENGEQMALIEVTDTGPGIPEDYKTRIFDRFQQVDRSKGHRRGTGLGLTFCRLTVEAHGGRIWIEDNPTGGSIFAFTLPLAVAQSGTVRDVRSG